MNRRSPSPRLAPRLRPLVLICSLLVGAPALAQDATVSAPAAAAPLSEVMVEWSGPNAPGDFIAIAAPDDKPEAFAAYARTSAGDPAALTAPELGEYEIRYVSAAGLKILARQPLSVRIRQEAMGLTAPQNAAPRAALTVSVADPGDPADFITIVEAGAPDDALGPYARLRGESQAEIEAPVAPGMYEIRQVQARDLTVLARASIEIGEPPAPEAAPAPEPAEAEAAPPPGEEPAAPAPAEDARPESAEPPAQESVTAEPPQDAPPAPAPAPAATAAAPASEEASLMALTAVDAGSEFHVAWTGPGAPGDVIAIAAPGDDEPLTLAPAAPGQPATLTAPGAPGDYLLRYVSGADGGVLTERKLEVR